MISVAQALELVLANVQSLQARRRALSESLSLVLADDVYSDIDSPPYDKALMDGYVIRLADAREGAELLVLEQITAGQTPRYPLRAGTATRIMTGAPIPVGAEAVIAIEQTRSSDDGKRVSLLRGGLNAGENILRQGAALRAGQCILQRGRELRPMEIGVLAEVGAYEVCVIPRPTIAVLATGNELVAHQDDPEPGQIRNSNGPMLLALSARANVDAFDLGIARDDAGELKASILRGLDHNVLVMSGGVSAGVMDLIPAVLEQLGVRQVFHHLDLKPGKPLWFGVHQQENHACLVFGLPGNPVSSLVCFELFVKPALAQLAGHDGAKVNRRVRATLTANHQQRDKRMTYFPAAYEQQGDQLQVTPLPWKGSADLRTLVDSNALIIFSSGPREYQAGECVDVHLL